MTRTRSHKMLFVTGFATLGFDTYKNLNYLENVDFFVYDTNNSLKDIEKRLEEQFLKNKYKILVGHSMGCFLITRLLKKLELGIGVGLDRIKKMKIILINPFVCNTFVTRLLTFFPAWFNIYVPKCIAIPSSGLIYSPGNKNWSLVGAKLLISAVKEMDISGFIEVWGWFDDVSVIYGVNDLVTPIPEDIQERMKEVTNFIPIYAKHEPFNDEYTIQTNFKNALLGLL